MTAGGLIALGLSGQVLFALRGLVQWAASERARRSVVPPAYWWMTVAAALILSIYAALRGDPILVVGPLVSLGLGLRNLSIQAGARGGISRRAVLPVAIGLTGTLLVATAVESLRRGADLPLGWVVLGLVGQALWTSRFVVQWWTSEVRGESVLSRGFWWLTITGSLLLAAYALLRRDWVFLLAYGFSPVPAARNLVLLSRAVTPSPASDPTFQPSPAASAVSV